jgi:hypothetical protein
MASDKPKRHDDDDDDKTPARAGKVTPPPVITPQAITPGTWPSPIDAYRSAVHGVAVTVVNPAAGDALLPYPTGTPLAVGSGFWIRNGYYKSATPT